MASKIIVSRFLLSIKLFASDGESCFRCNLAFSLLVWDISCVKFLHVSEVRIKRPDAFTCRTLLILGSIRQFTNLRYAIFDFFLFGFLNSPQFWERYLPISSCFMFRFLALYVHLIEGRRADNRLLGIHCDFCLIQFLYLSQFIFTWGTWKYIFNAVLSKINLLQVPKGGLWPYCE